MLKVKIIGLYKKGYVWCVALKRVNSSPNKNVGVVCKSYFLSGCKFTTTGIPEELHLPTYSFCGPGTNLDKRLNEVNNPKP